MVDVVNIKPKSSMPNEDADFIQIVRRFDTENPQQAIIDIDFFISASKQRHSVRSAWKSEAENDMEDAMEQAVELAEQRQIGTIYVADLTQEDWS